VSGVGNRPLPTPNFGGAPENYDRQWMSSFLSLLTRKLGLAAGPNTIQQQILLQAPNGITYAVSVSNTGTLQTAVASRATGQAPV
jgi:hypothetical protein